MTRVAETGGTEAQARFQALVTAVLGRGKGILLVQLGAARALAEELERPEPSPEKVRHLARRLELDAADLPEAGPQEASGGAGEMPQGDLFAAGAAS